MGGEIYNFIFKNSCFEEFFERNIHVYAIQILTKSYEKDENTTRGLKKFEGLMGQVSF